MQKMNQSLQVQSFNFERLSMRSLRDVLDEDETNVTELALELSAEQRAEFKEAFQMFDKDKDGVIKVDELEMVMKLLDQNMTKNEVRDMFNEADADGNGSIDFNEFLSMMAQKMTKHDIQDEMKQAFRVFDSDQTGCLSSDEIRHIMTTYGETLTKEEVDEMLAVADVNRNGQIPYMDYIKEVASALHDLH